MAHSCPALQLGKFNSARFTEYFKWIILQLEGDLVQLFLRAIGSEVQLQDAPDRMRGSVDHPVGRGKPDAVMQRVDLYECLCFLERMA